MKESLVQASLAWASCCGGEWKWHLKQLLEQKPAANHSYRGRIPINNPLLIPSFHLLRPPSALFTSPSLSFSSSTHFSELECMASELWALFAPGGFIQLLECFCQDCLLHREIIERDARWAEPAEWLRAVHTEDLGRVKLLEGELLRGTGGALASTTLTVQRSYSQKVSLLLLSCFKSVILFIDTEL